MLSFIYTGLPAFRAPIHGGYRRVAVCTAQKPGEQGKAREGETVWGEFGTEGRMKKKRVRRRQAEEEDLDWDNLPSVPLVRPDASPESGEDYWMDLENANNEGEKKEGEVKPEVRKKKIDDEMKERLKQEVISPYTQNWILRVVIVIAVLIAAVAIFGGAENTPIISVPDL